MDINSFALGYSAGKKKGGADLLSSIIDGSVTEIESDCESVRNYAFYNCRALLSIKCPNAKSVGSKSITGCPKLQNIDFSSLDTIANSMFKEFGSLESVNFAKATIINGDAFYSCSKLTSVNFPNVTTINASAFGACAKLPRVDLPKVTSIANSVFAACYSLTALILRSESLCTLGGTNVFYNCYHILGTQNTTYNPNGAKDGYIYVPSALVASYRSATNWSAYASQFRALEDYTVDGTITGDLDPNKI